MRNAIIDVKAWQCAEHPMMRMPVYGAIARGVDGIRWYTQCIHPPSRWWCWELHLPHTISAANRRIRMDGLVCAPEECIFTFSLFIDQNETHKEHPTQPTVSQAHNRAEHMILFICCWYSIRSNWSRVPDCSANFAHSLCRRAERPKAKRALGVGPCVGGFQFD